MSLTRSLVFSAAFATAATIQAQTTPDPAPFLAPVQAFTRAFNAYRTDLPAGIFTDQVTIIDDFAPFAWSGRGDAADWYAGLIGRTPEERAKTGLRAIQARLTLGTPRFLRAEGDHAYFVLPATLTYLEGTTHKTQHARWILAEARVHGTWLVSAHAWGIETETP